VPHVAVVAHAVDAARSVRDTYRAVPLIVRQDRPFNAETSPEALVRSWVTPVRDFFVRSHAPVPDVDPAAFRLTVEGLVDRPLTLSLDDLRRDFSSREETALLQCAGNRRDGHSQVAKIKDDVPWEAGAIGNAAWRGVGLADILARAGVRPGAAHVWLTGLDDCETKAGTTAFGASIPLDKALAPETLIATEMNGEPLAPEHGFPARAVVPGFIGARSVKWLATIVVADRPSDNYYQARTYKVFPPDVDAHNVVWESAAAIEEIPLNSAICVPAGGTPVPAGPLRVCGYACASGRPGRKVARVEVSGDGGATWADATIVSRNEAFAWCLWEATVAARPGPAVLVARATDTSGGAQPESNDWNFKGYLYNAWHRVPISVG
jgi:sulfite oxidase